MDEAEQKLKPIRVILETIRERADYALKTTSGSGRGAVDALEMQRLPVRKALYAGSSIGGHGSLPPLQKYFI